MHRLRSRAAAASLVLVPLLAAGPAPAQEKASAAWRIGPSDFVSFERRRVTKKDGKETLGKPEIETLRGSDLRDEGLYLPAAPARREDLPRIFAFRFVGGGSRASRLTFSGVGDVLADADFISVPAADGALRVEATWRFASSRAKTDETWEIRDGTGDATITLAADGAVAAARVSVAYVLDRREHKKGEKPRTIDETWDFVRKDLRKPRFAGFHEDVAAAIDRGVKHLRTLQKEDGTFEPHGDWVAGSTALSLYTLLACGVPRDDPQVAKGLAWLEAADPRRNYELATALLAMERAYVEPGNEGSEAKQGADMPASRRAWCVRVAQRLEMQCKSPGSWGYPDGSRSLYQLDSSNTQYAALGLRAAARLGIPVKEQSWLGLIRHFKIHREKDAPRAELVLAGERGTSSTTSAPVKVDEAAGFLYRAHYEHPHGSMTCAGVGSLAIARDELRRAGKPLSGREEQEVEGLILGGWAWLDRNYAIDRHPLHGDWFYYWLYSLERAGLLTGVRLVNGKDWYFDGAMELLARQETNGSWDEPGTGTVTETCFALLFLKRATAPAAAVTGK